VEVGQVDGDACRFSVEDGVGEDRSTDTGAVITRSDRNQHTVKPLINHTPRWTYYRRLWVLRARFGCKIWIRWRPKPMGYGAVRLREVTG
jgi:hypothetical protein